MAVVQTGSILTFIGLGTANTGTVSTTITVPSDAELVVVGWSGFSTTADFFDQGSMTFTKGGADTAMTMVAGSDTSNWSGAMAYLALPDTGSNKTLKWDWLGAGTSSDPSTMCSVSFWKGIDTASPVRGTGFGSAGTQPYTTGTITAASGDLFIAWCPFFSGLEDTINTWTGLSTLEQETISGNADAAWATGSPSGNAAVAALTRTIGGDGALFCISVKAAAAVTAAVAPLNQSFIQKFAVPMGPFDILPNTVGKLVDSGVVDNPEFPLQGNLVLSPTAPTVLVSNNFNIVPLQGNLVLSPTAETVSTNFNIVPLQGNLVLSPTAETVAVSNNISIVPPQGNLVLSPTAETVAVSNNISIVPPQGNLVLSPTAETVTLSNNINFVVPQGNLILSEVAPNVSSKQEIQIGFSQGFLFHPGRGPSWDIIKRAAFPADIITANRNIVSPQGNLVLSPSAESLGFGLTPAQGNLVLSPTAESLGFGLKPAQGNLALSPTAETVVTTANFAFTIPQGNLVLSPTAPSIAAQVPQGNLVLSPTAPTVVWTDNHPITVPQGNLVLSPTAESLGLGLKPAQGNAALSPTAPTVVWTDNHPITVPQGNVALSPTAPQIGGAMSRLPPQGNVALSPTAPTVVATANWAIVPPQGNVALSPTAPNSVVNFRITVAQGNIVLSGTPPQTTPGIHPVSGNLVLTASPPTIEIKHTHHWQQVISITGNTDAGQSLRGNKNQQSSLEGG